MTFNRASTVFGLVSQGIDQRLGSCNAYRKYWWPEWAKPPGVTSLQYPKNEGQRSIEDF